MVQLLVLFGSQPQNKTQDMSIFVQAQKKIFELEKKSQKIRYLFTSIIGGGGLLRGGVLTPKFLKKKNYELPQKMKENTGQIAKNARF